MASNSQQGAAGPPAKPCERVDTSSGPTPFKAPSSGSTSDVVEASGTAKPGEIVSTVDRNTTVNALTRPVPTRPWEQQNYGSTTYGGYNSGLNYNSGYGSGMYGSSYNGFGGSYGGGLYGNNMYRGGYSGLYGSSGMYGGGMYNSGFGGPMGYGMGMGGPFGEQDPNNTYSCPPSPPGFWISFLRVMQGVVNFFWPNINSDRPEHPSISHVYVGTSSAFDRSGLLYGELARFVLRLLGIKTKPRKANQPGPNGLPGPYNPHGNQNCIEGPKSAPSATWDNLWGENGSS